MGKKTYRFCNPRNEKISIKNSLPYLECVLLLSCVVHGPIYGPFMGFYVNVFSLYKGKATTGLIWDTNMAPAILLFWGT